MYAAAAQGALAAELRDIGAGHDLSGVRATLEAALERASQGDDARASCWELRRALDAVVEGTA